MIKFAGKYLQEFFLFDKHNCNKMLYSLKKLFNQKMNHNK